MAKRNDPLARALDVVHRLMQHPHATALFNSPVDVEGLGLDDYATIVSTPMCLGTIRDRLLAGANSDWAESWYKSSAQVFADTQLVWNNCIAYNTRPDEVEYADAAREMHALSLAAWDAAGLERPGGGVGGTGQPAQPPVVAVQPPVPQRLLSEQQIPPGHDVIPGSLPPSLQLSSVAPGPHAGRVPAESAYGHLKFARIAHRPMRCPSAAHCRRWTTTSVPVTRPHAYVSWLGCIRTTRVDPEP